MTDNRHPSLEDLALYAEQADRFSGVSEVEQHLENCPDCFAAVALHRALLDAESLGTEDAPLLNQKQASLQPSVENVNTEQLNTGEPSVPGKSSQGLGSALSSLLAGLGLGSLGGFAHPDPMPAFGKEAAHNEHPTLDTGSDWNHDSILDSHPSGSEFNDHGITNEFGDDDGHGHHG